MARGTDGDSERDAWLTEALRHAPDANATPPTAMREAILRQARAATASPRATTAVSLAQRMLAVWSWLARPPVAAGFASVMVATLVGLMWWDQPMDETLPRPPVPTPAPDAPRPGIDTPTAAATPTGEAVATDRSAPAQERGGAGTPTPPARADKAARAIAPAAARPKQSGAERAEPAAFGDDLRSQAPAPAAAAAPAARMRESAGTVDAPAAAARDESARPLASPAARSLARAGPASAAPDAPAPPLRRDGSPQDPAQAAPVAALLSSATEQPQRWRWRRSADAQAMNAAVLRWLQQLDRAAAPQWRAAAGATPPAEAATLRLYRDDTLQATLHFDPDAVWFTPAAAGAPASRAALPPATLAALKRMLDDATP